MPGTIAVDLCGPDGQPLPENVRRTLYASDLHWRPWRRQVELGAGGSVELELRREPAMLHANLPVPGFGHTWIESDNGGEGYRAGQRVEFVLDAARSRLAKVRTVLGDAALAFRPSLELSSHLAGAEDRIHAALGASDPAKRGTAALQGLSAALWAGELAVVEVARRGLASAGPRKGFLFGCNAFKYPGDPASAYAQRFADALNFATLPFYLRGLEPEEGKPDYRRVDAILDWCEEVGIKPKGHPLWWLHQAGVPDWLAGSDWPTARAHCERVVRRSVERYAGRIAVWDVINEAHDWANGLNLTHDQLVEITRVCVDTCHAANPDATAIVNICVPFGEPTADGKVHWGPVYDHVRCPLDYLDVLFETGVALDVIGVQIYFPARDMLAISLLLDEYARFGAPIHVTELGVASGPRDDAERAATVWHAPWSQRVQAEWVEWFYTVAMAKPYLEAITWWDFADPAFIKLGGFLNEDDTPKQSYFRLQALTGGGR